jgi:hypothetical protein
LYDEAADRIILDLLDFGINRVNIPADLENKGDRPFAEAPKSA